MNFPSLAAERIVSINPATGGVIGQIEVTPPKQIPLIVADARAAQLE